VQPGELGWALSVLLRAHARSTDRALHDLPGGARAFRLLAAVGTGRPNQLALAQASGLDRTVVTYLLDDLVEARLVERQADPCDRRARRIVLTDEGARRLVDFRRRLEPLDGHLLEGLPPEEVDELRRLLRCAAVAAQRHDPSTCAHAESPTGPQC